MAHGPDSQLQVQIIIHTQPRERQRSQRETEIAQCDIEIAWHQQEVHDDAPQPQRNDVGAYARRANAAVVRSSRNTSTSSFRATKKTNKTRMCLDVDRYPSSSLL
jgi:hypothetical protein